MPSPRYSVVIPTLQEEAHLQRAIESALIAYRDDCEIVVVDGGSTDATRDIARRYGRVLVRSGGRGSQLNAGAARAIGDVLIFLHADTRVEASSGAEIERALRSRSVAGGCHLFRVDPPATSLRFRLLEAGVNLRSRAFGTATGDQAIFARRGCFEEIGGFPDYPIFEDVTLVRRLRRIGRFELLEVAAHTSRRRWEESGFLRTVALHWLLRGAYRMGVKPRRLARRYAGADGRPARSSRR
jgi:rSAM/selenodomain-associated transferase 2